MTSDKPEANISKLFMAYQVVKRLILFLLRKKLHFLFLLLLVCLLNLVKIFKLESTHFWTTSLIGTKLTSPRRFWT